MNLDLGYTKLIIEKCKEYRLTLEQAAYVLGTAYHETGHTMKPVYETMAPTLDRAIAILDREWEKPSSIYYKHRGTVRTPYWKPDKDGKSWIGRGISMITLKGNYVKWSERLGIDLVKDPELVMDPRIGARMLVEGMAKGWWTGKKLSDYINSSQKDYLNARRTVNGMIHVDVIADYARKYEDDLRKIGYKPKMINPVPAVVGAGAGSSVVWADYAPWIIIATVVIVAGYMIYKKARK